MSKLTKNICVIITARTSYTKIKSILYELKNKKSILLNIVCSSSAVSEMFGNIEGQIKKDKFKIYRTVHSLLDDKSLNSSTKSVALSIIEFANIFKSLNPDLVLVIADRYEIIAPVIAASYQNIPVGHVQGGELSGNIDEKVRHAVTKFADIHFPSTKKSYLNLVRMGENKNNIFLTGCPSLDIAKKIQSNPFFNFDIYKKYKGVGPRFKYIIKNYIIVMFHPDTNEINKTEIYTKTLLNIVKRLDINAYWFWPNADPGSSEISKILRVERDQNKLPKIHLFKNMEPDDFLRLLNNAKGIIGNSSVGIRESSFLGVPSINIGLRQIGRERASNVLDIKHVKESDYSKIHRHFRRKIKSSNLYGDGKSGKRIANIIEKKEFSYKKIFCK